MGNIIIIFFIFITLHSGRNRHNDTQAELRVATWNFRTLRDSYDAIITKDNSMENLDIAAVNGKSLATLSF